MWVWSFGRDPMVAFGGYFVHFKHTGAKTGGHCREFRGGSNYYIVLMEVQSGAVEFVALERLVTSRTLERGPSLLS